MLSSTRLSTSLLLALSLLGGAAPASAEPSAPPMSSTDSTEEEAMPRNSLRLPHGDEPEVMIVAHRGQWRSHPENSVPGIVRAIQDGADIVEIDLALTKDGHLVLMHDATVDRTTDGSGRVEDMTLAELRALRLREGQGNGPAPLTDLTVPTFAEALQAVSGRNALLNIDKGWEHRDQLAAEIEAADMESHILMKGAPTADHANAFMAEHPDIQLMHALSGDQAAEYAKFTTRVPAVVAAPEGMRDEVGAETDLWGNSLAYAIGGPYTDEASLRDPGLGWQHLADDGIDVIQTDNVRMMAAWRDGVDLTRVGMTSQSLRVQAEDFLDEPGLHLETTPENLCGARAIRRVASPVDACDLDGAHVVQYIHDGEYFTLEVEVERPGTYFLTVRHSSDTEPGGKVTAAAGDGPARTTSLRNTTHNRAFTVSDLGRYRLDRGTHRIRLEFEHPDYMSVDWIQLDRGPMRDGGLLR
jgi:glycerophosphoryl diester phosphodiesterase